MIWFWVILVIILFIGLLVYLFMDIVITLKGEPEVNIDNKVFVLYLFVYKIVEGDPKVLPTEFLVNWKLRDLENHLYLLYLTLEKDLDIEKYLHKVLVGYSGDGNIYGKVYRIEGIMEVRNILIGTWEVVEGRFEYNKIG